MVWMTLRFMMTILVLVASIDGISQWAGGAPEVCCCRHWPLVALSSLAPGYWHCKTQPTPGMYITRRTSSSWLKEVEECQESGYKMILITMVEIGEEQSPGCEPQTERPLLQSRRQYIEHSQYWGVYGIQ